MLIKHSERVSNTQEATFKFGIKYQIIKKIILFKDALVED